MGCGTYFLKLFGKRDQQNLKTMEQIEELLGGTYSHEQKMFINKDQDDQMEICYYRRSRAKAALTYLGFILTCGLFRLICHWVPRLYLYSTCVTCKISEADKILIVELYNGKHKIYHIEDLNIIDVQSIRKMKKDEFTTTEDLVDLPSLSVHMEKGEFRNVEKLLIFTVKRVSYIYNNDLHEFVKLTGLDNGVPCSVFHEYKPLTANENLVRRLVYGTNVIDVKVTSILTLLFLEVLNPFYVFQVFSFILWFCDQYYYYAGAIILVSLVGIIMSVRETRRFDRSLKDQVRSIDNCTVLRSVLSGGSENNIYKSEIIPTSTLVPGDILEIPAAGCTMLCDAVLLNGSCILNESMLTGESVPVTKTALPNSATIIYHPTEHARHTLFSGTKVIQTRYSGDGQVLAVVTRTGFCTAKGSLVRSILYPPPVDFRFEKDSYKFIKFLACLAAIGFIYTVIDKFMRGTSITDIILQALDLITIVVPPALPAAMTVGSVSAQRRLKKKEIFCVSPRTINVSGGVNCVCFDKTGTLTEDGMDLLCVIPVSGGVFSSPVEIVKTLAYDTFLYGLVCCHSLTTINKEVVGDPMDLKMFHSTEWMIVDDDIADQDKFDMIVTTALKPPSESSRARENQNIIDDLGIGILREFPFSSSSQRMGVVIRRLNGDHFEYYCKGSPEKILELVREDTIPSDFHEVLDKYAHEGYRVLGIAHKELHMKYTKVQKVQRDAIEKDLTFLGLIVFENRLKPATAPCIRDLNNAGIRIIMVTGDNILTSLSVARKCDMIHLEQNIITVNCTTSHPPTVFYTLNNLKEPLKDHSLPSNSASIVSLDTIESQLQTTSANTFNDNVTTGNGVAKPLSYNYRFAITGKTWGAIKEHHPDLLPRICTRGTVFARMAPEQKQQLVHELQSLGYCVAMCGDGANDCGALKAAHTGISLSDAESSVASPFTSKIANISCVLNVIREGRSALVTSFGIFKFMAGYSLCQFVSVLILYSIQSNLTDVEYLYIDLFIISGFAYYFGRTEAYTGKLTKQTPLSSLISLSPLLSLSLQLLLVVVFQVASFEHLKLESWYQPYNGTDPDDVGCVENYTLFTISSFQYIILAIVFSKGYPYRKSIFSNWGFILCTLLLGGFSVYLAVYPSSFFQTTFELIIPESMNFRLYLLGYALANCVISLLVEHYIVDNFVFKNRFKYHNVDKSKKKYLAIERDLKQDLKWPELTTEFRSAASPQNPIPEYSTQIVIETETKFDKNHVLNKLYDNSNGTNSSPNSAFTTPNHHYSTPHHQVHKLSLGNHETGYFSEENLDFSSLPSENLPSPSRSETYKSLSNNQSSYDMASSQLNIPDIPYDDASVTIIASPISPSKSINISLASSGQGASFENSSPTNYSQFNAFSISKSPPDNQNGESWRLELNNLDVNR